ncbi:MAG: hypothetical protein WHV67_01965 [Thermoanaerobaculia bacterium]
MKKFFITLISFVFTLGLFAQGNPSDVITQGAFALKVVKVMKAKLPLEATEQDAVSFLETLGLTPSEGWNISKSLTEKTMSEILVIAGGNLSPIQPNALVTNLKADQILQQHGNVFRKFYLTKMAADNKTESEIVDEGALKGVAASPTIEK